LQLSDGIVSGYFNLIGNRPIAILYVVLLQNVVPAPVCVGEMAVCVYVHMYVCMDSLHQKTKLAVDEISLCCYQWGTRVKNIAAIL
jgi:hypothetical protein